MGSLQISLSLRMQQPVIIVNILIRALKFDLCVDFFRSISRLDEALVEDKN